MNKINELLNTKDYTLNYSLDSRKESKLLCLISYFWFLFFLPLLNKNNKYCLYHANQSLCLFLFSIGGGLVTTLITILLNSISLNIISFIFKITFSVIVVSLFIIGIVNVLNDSAKDLPIIGKIRIIKC